MSRFLRLFLPLLLLTPFLSAQFGSGIQGTILDSSSAVIPNVRVVVKNVDTGVVREVLSSEVGVYRVLSLSPGTYSVMASREGFVRAEQPSVVLGVDEVRKVDFTLNVGNVSESVSVTAQPTILATEEGRISGRFELTQLQELPVPNRNVYNILVLQPGVSGRNLEGSDSFTGRSYGRVNASGARADSNSFNLNGMNTNSVSRGGSVEVSPSLESVEEVRVVTNNFSADEGRNMGAHVSVSSKAGTNEFHGSLWEYHRDSKLQSRGFFDTTVPVSRRNQFGYTVGGPIFKNKTFFFTSYEGARLSGSATATATVETEQFRDFVLQTRPKSIAANLLNNFRPLAYPTFNLKDLGSPLPGVNKFSSTPDGIPDIGTVRYLSQNNTSSNQFTFRVDHELRPGKDRVYVYYYRFRGGEARIPPVRPMFLRYATTWGDFGNVNHTHIFSPTTLNELRASVTRSPGLYSDLNHKEVPEIQISGVSTSNASTGSSAIRDVNVFPGGWFPTEYVVNDMLSTVRGTHALKIGGEFRWAKNILWHTRYYIPAYSFYSILDFADDEPYQMNRTVDPRTGNPITTRADQSIHEGALFVQDDWKLRRNLTLNIGLRYDYFGPYTDTSNRLRNFLLGTGSGWGQQIANGKVDIVPQSWNTDWANFAPRFGFAWDIGGKGKNVIRGGYGISYDRLATVYTAGYRENPPVASSATLGTVYGTAFTYTLGDPSKPYYGYPLDPGLQLGLDSHNGIKGARVALRAVDYGFNNPYTHNWFLGVQRLLPAQMVVEVSYIGSAGHHLVNIADINRYNGDMLDGIFNGFNSSFSQINMARTSSNSIYHGGTISVRRQFSKGYSFQTAYTYGKVITDAEAEQDITNYYDVNNRNLDRSLASFDVPQRLAIVGVWEIPFLRSCTTWACKVAGGWQLSGYAILEKGLPMSVYTTAPYPRGDYNADGTNYDRPNAPATTVQQKDFTQQQFLTGIFSVTNFPVPASGQVGNLGRNTYRAPGFARVDFSLAKSFRIAERLRANLRLDSFNAFNRVNLSAPSGDLNSNNFGKVTAAQAGRTYQLGLLLRF